MLGADGAGKRRHFLKLRAKLLFNRAVLGTVIDSSLPDDELVNKRVFLTPSRGWKSHPTGPERKYEHLSGYVTMPRKIRD